MSGGIAYVLDLDGKFPRGQQGDGRAGGPERSRRSGVGPSLVRKHVEYTGSARGRWVLDHWDELVGQLPKMLPAVYQAHADQLQGGDCRR